MPSRRSKVQRAPSLFARLRAVQGWKRNALIAAAAIGALALVGFVGGTAYSIDQENHDAFCASCHTQPETQYYQQSLATTSLATLAAFHAQKNVRCIDCHSGGGPFGRAAGLTQGAVDLLAYQSGHYHTPAVTLSKLGDDSCLKCHANVTANSGFNNHFHAFLSRWQAVDTNAAHCVDCHTAHPTTGDPTQQFLQVQSVQTICGNCHRTLAQ